VPESKWIQRLAILGILAPFAANSAGWVFTEMGRQPFSVVPNPTPSGVDGVFMFTAASVSPGVGPGEMLFSLISLTLVYGVLLVVEIKLLTKYVRGGIVSAMPEIAHAGDHNDDEFDDDEGGANGARRTTKPTDDVLSFAY
jgi:cytochrome d ubiquinol oxidase subunit I